MICSWVINLLGNFLGDKALNILCEKIGRFFYKYPWKITLKQLKKNSKINDDTIIRISFAYLFRIKIQNDYLLVKNNRTGKFQPVGGVYKFNPNEKIFLKNNFHVIDDDKIPIDETSFDDYRLRMNSQYLYKFVRRFDKDASREKIDNLVREFKEELVDSEIVKWKQVQYRFCGRHYTDLQFSEHFQIYELLLADIVELIPTPEQEDDLRRLKAKQSDKYIFANKERILSRGINTKKAQYIEYIADHSQKILLENEDKLIKVPLTGNIFTINKFN